MISKGVAEKLSREKMISLVTRAENEGMVLQPENTQNPNFICCCCGCCCGVLTAAKKYAEPAGFMQTNFYAEVDAETCVACGDCIEMCQMDAMVSVDDHTEVLRSHCIGCGVCLNACITDAISLLKKEKEAVPPKNTQEMYKNMILDRYGVLGSLKIMGKAALGRKI